MPRKSKAEKQFEEDVKTFIPVADLLDHILALVDAAEAEYKALGISNDTGVGYLAPIEMSTEIIKEVTSMWEGKSLPEMLADIGINRSLIELERDGARLMDEAMLRRSKRLKAPPPRLS